MSDKLSTRFKTRPIMLTRVTLYEAKSFKPKQDENKDGTQEAATPSFRIKFNLDKDNATDMQSMESINGAIDNAIENAISNEEWAEADAEKASLFLKDADVDTVRIGDGRKKRKVVLSKEYPELTGKYTVGMSRKERRGRPGVRYVDEYGRIVQLPDPIINPQTEEEERESARISALWDKWVFPGQYAVVTGTARPYALDTGSVGVTGMVDNILIIGGGQRLNSVSFESDFSKNDAAELLAWREKHTPMATASLDGDDSDDEEVDAETGEVSEPKSPARRSRRTETEGKPKRRTSKRRAAESDDDKPSDVTSDDVDDDMDDEDIF